MMLDTCTVNSSVMNQLMLGFRPIAPKPAGGDDLPAAAELERRSVAIGNRRRTKRKYVRVRGRPSTKKKTRSSPPEKYGIEDNSFPEKGVVTLQLLPERSESDNTSYNSTALKLPETDNRHKAENEVSYRKAEASGGGSGGTLALGNVRSVTKTWMIVDCVTETNINSGVGLGFSDGEKIRNLQGDTRPGFVSDSFSNVVWINETFRKMVEEGEATENGLMVWLVVKENLPYLAPSFACRVRMIHQTKHGHKWNRVVPCDVWRMEFAGFAWKLDVQTALGLGI